MLRRFALPTLLAASCALAACSGADFTAILDDAGAGDATGGDDGATGDGAASDATIPGPDAASDATTRDASVDTSADTATDGTSLDAADAGADATQDAGADAPPDAQPDATGDASDASSDGASGDAASDGASSDAGDAGCSPACRLGFTCCNGQCVNDKNDILNCGMCGRVCTGSHPYCNNGTCGTPPCNGVLCPVSEFCCGTQCCTQGDLCCDVPGPILTGPHCTAPVNGTCPVGCPLCP